MTDKADARWAVPYIASNSKKDGTVSIMLKRCFVVFLCIALAAHSVGYGLHRWSSPHLPAASETLETSFDWAKAKTLPHLQYSPCYEDFQCARLELPLDYWNGTTDATISLAVIRKPAAVPIDDPRYGGAILVNPGGPGGSGISLVRASGPSLSYIVDARPADYATGKFFDIISFDPRGVGVSEPAVHCFRDGTYTQSWGLRIMEEGALTSSDAALGRQWSMSHAEGAGCISSGDEDIKHFLTTASVAHDMLNIVEAHGQWREKEAKRLMAEKASTISRVKGNEFMDSKDSTVFEELRYKPGREQLQYWGFSYGTYLGTTFASLFPERVGRLILDGVVDAEDYTANLWYDNLVDTEKTVNLFYYHCARVGFPGCQLAMPGGTAEDVSKRTQAIISSLYHNPLPVVSPNIDIVSWSDIRNLIFASLYAPIASFPFLANTLAAIEKGDGTPLAQLLGSYHQISCSSSEAAASGLVPLRNRTGTSMPSDPFAQSAILCADGDPQSSQTKSTFTDYMHGLQTMSPTIGDLWAAVKLSCIGYEQRPVFRYTGPWSGETAHPILYIGNTADPVTPVGNAHKLSKGFPGSVVLTQNSPGHCSTSAFSVCTVGYINQYFQTGVMPPEGVTCEPEVLPFGPGPEDVTISAEVQVMAERHAGMENALYMAGGGLMRGRMMGRVQSHAGLV